MVLVIVCRLVGAYRVLYNSFWQVVLETEMNAFETSHCFGNQFLVKSCSLFHLLFLQYIMHVSPLSLAVFQSSSHELLTGE